MKTRLAVASLVLLATGCRDGEYLYHWTPAPVIKSVTTHKVKEVLSSSQVDIVWVVDNSGSMYVHQRNVARNAEIFLSTFAKSAGMEWTLSLISTDPSESSFLGFESNLSLDWKTKDPVPVFQIAVQQLGIGGVGEEQMFVPFENAVDRAPRYLRPSAVLAIVVVTDAPEQSAFVSSSDFLGYLAQIKGNLNQVVTYGILGPQEWCMATDDLWNYAGSKYEAVIQATHGKAYRLCTSDFGTALADMGKDLVSRVSNPRVFLEQRPKAGTLRVFYNSALVPGGASAVGGKWIYDVELNAVVFSDLSFAPSENEKIDIEYEIDDGF